MPETKAETSGETNDVLAYTLRKILINFKH
jgi:hypothetical protein